MVDENGGEALSVIVITHDEEDDIARCLESVSWADEIVVVDSGSVDRTIEIAREYTDSVLEREFTDFSDQREFAAARCRNDWVLSIDADEVISSELRSEIEAAVSCGRCDAYYLPEATYIFGGWLRHGSGNPDYHIRLYRRSKGRWQGVVHERVVTEESIGFLDNPILHYSYQDISSFVVSMNSYTSLEAELTEQRPEHLVRRLCLRPVKMFVNSFILQAGFLDGERGLIVSTLGAIHEFLRWAKISVKSNLYASGDKAPAFCPTVRIRLMRWLMKRGLIFRHPGAPPGEMKGTA
jgi:glycosyltransferase involved in cell wall biosynthesis